MDFYKDIAQRLYTGNTKINGTNFSNSFEFIEAIHKLAEFKGKVFYKNLIDAMQTGERFANKKKGEKPSYREELYFEIVEYCIGKVEEIEELEIAGNPNHVLYNFDNLMFLYYDVLRPAGAKKFIDGEWKNLFSFYLEDEYKGEDNSAEKSTFISKLMDKGALAQIEIDNLIYANNNNTEFLVKRIIQEYHSLINQFENFDKKYESFTLENKPILHRYKDAKNSFYGFFSMYLDVFKKYDSDNLLGLNSEDNIESVETKKFENIYQKLMLLDELNLLDKICEVSGNIVSSTQVSKIVAEIIGESSTTTVARALQFFSESGKVKPKGKNNPFTKNNYSFLINKLVYLGLHKQMIDASEKYADVLRNKG